MYLAQWFHKTTIGTIKQLIDLYIRKCYARKRLKFSKRNFQIENPCFSKVIVFKYNKELPNDKNLLLNKTEISKHVVVKF